MDSELLTWHPDWHHWLWAGVIGALFYPFKKLLEFFEEFWGGFKAGFMKGFKQTPFGKAFMESYEKGKAAEDAKMKAEYPDYKPED